MEGIQQLRDIEVFLTRLSELQFSNTATPRASTRLLSFAKETTYSHGVQRKRIKNQDLISPTKSHKVHRAPDTSKILIYSYNLVLLFPLQPTQSSSRGQPLTTDRCRSHAENHGETVAQGYVENAMFGTFANFVAMSRFGVSRGLKSIWCTHGTCRSLDISNNVARQCLHQLDRTQNNTNHLRSSSFVHNLITTSDRSLQRYGRMGNSNPLARHFLTTIVTITLSPPLAFRLHFHQPQHQRQHQQLRVQPPTTPSPPSR
jgi:hypothetical protein